MLGLDVKKLTAELTKKTALVSKLERFLLTERKKNKQLMVKQRELERELQRLKQALSASEKNYKRLKEEIHP